MPQACSGCSRCFIIVIAEIRPRETRYLMALSNIAESGVTFQPVTATDLSWPRASVASVIRQESVINAG